MVGIHEKFIKDFSLSALTLKYPAGLISSASFFGGIS
jgi:hypothetical protein